MMAYEAQIAGLGDEPPGGRCARARSARCRRARRASSRGRRAAVVAAVSEVLRAAGAPPLRARQRRRHGQPAERPRREPAVTEVTAGSGLYAPTLFDAYSAFTPRPAALFALPVVRRPGRGVVTALGGGYLASGPADAARLPRPYLPRGLRLDGQEGAGEVQTPLLGAAADELAIGDRVYMRHAKAGELCERFDSLHLLEGERIVDEVPTYRGEGQVLPVSAPAQPAEEAALDAILREVVETLAPLDRTPCSPGEREAAEWLAARTARRSPAWRWRSRTRTRGARSRRPRPASGLLGIVAAALRAARAPRGRRRCSRGRVRGDRRRGAERPAHPAPPGAPARGDGQRRRRRARRRRRGTEHARRARPSRRAADGRAVRPDAAATPLRARAAGARTLQDAAAAVVDRPRRRAGDDRRRAQRRAAASRARALAVGALGTAAVADIWRNETVQGANDNLSGVAALVALARAAARATRAGPARAARLLRRRGDAAGRHPRVRRAPPRRARPGAHGVRQPRHGRLAAPGACSRPRGRCGWRATPGRGCATCRRRAPSGSASRCSAASARARRPTA